MDRLTPDQQADIQKMSKSRLTSYLIQAGVDGETAYAMKKQQLMDEWAELVAQGHDSPPQATSPTTVISGDSSLNSNLERERLEFEKRRYQEEKEERRKREEKEELEKQREFKLREDQLSLERERQRQADLERQARDEERVTRRSLASRIKYFGDALKGVLGKFPQDSAEIPCYFDHVERLFDQIEVDDDVRANLLLANLNERTKALTARLTQAQLNNYKDLKEFLLKEFRISPIQLRERFISARKLPEETYSSLASRLRNALVYYLRSRRVNDRFDELVSLLCADRMKELLPRDCLNFILAQEKGDWLRYDELANSVDTYMASHHLSGEPIRHGNPTPYRDSRPPKPTTQHESAPAKRVEQVGGASKEGKLSREEAMRRGLCFLCAGQGHRSHQCPKNKGAEADKKSAKVNACTADPTLSLTPHDNEARSETRDGGHPNCRQRWLE